MPENQPWVMYLRNENYSEYYYYSASDKKAERSFNVVQRTSQD
jgi:hypothetical protein